MLDSSSLTVFKSDDGIELVINTVTGEAFATQMGYSRMSKVSKQAISKRCLTVNQIILKTAEILTTTGLKTVNLIPAKTVFLWLMKDNPDLAAAMGEAGATVYIHQMAGYKVVSNAVTTPAPQSYLEALKALVASEEEKERLQLANNQLQITNTQQQEVIDELFNYSSIIRIAKFNHISEKSYNWRLLKAASLKLKLEIKVAPCQRYGTKLLYPHTAWMLVYPETKLPEDGTSLAAA